MIEQTDKIGLRLFRGVINLCPFAVAVWALNVVTNQSVRVTILVAGAAYTALWFVFYVKRVDPLVRRLWIWIVAQFRTPTPQDPDQTRETVV